MSATCVIGLQWGDEAKGKIVDLLTAQSDIVVRYQGGANAGHTVVFGGVKYKLSLIPSGIFRPEVKSVVASGVVVDPEAILGEIERLRDSGVEIAKNLLISDRAHVIFPWHKEEDRLMNDSGVRSEAIGTTMRGIGPCYRDKVGRSTAIRIGDLYRPDFPEKVRKICALKNRSLPGMAPTDEVRETVKPLDAEKIVADYTSYAERLKPFVGDVVNYLLDAVDANKKMLLEGAQGSLLDVDYGTFPYVTSSNSSGVGVIAGSGLPATFIKRVVGIVKAYTTRVGGGPFPTELKNDVGQRIRDRGNEYGTVTRRPRRCGWFDAVAARYTSRLGGATELSVMLLDVLSGFEEVNICVAYELDGKRITYFPSDVDDLARVVPIYETLPGWSEEIDGVTSYDDLPTNAKNYLERLSQVVGKPVSIVSVGPSREQTIVRNL
ncbi:MAG: adenylosuccinate synthase [Thermoguttaceae bacterium]|nr:adenylosuccinate synthase [Thermoguttaceae bacterium]